ncbi:MAG: sodium-dependent bicarbonate transport family permease [Proteobacteria bacterium]|nr:sodium-dependent bicarbonate transport family permease [Pseudomonadota bacterium]
MPFETLQSNLFSPAVLAFFLGFIAVVFKSDLKLPDGLYQAVSVYLLLSLGIKGGAAFNTCSVDTFILPFFITIGLGIILPFLAFSISRLFHYSRVDSSAIAAHYGSVSVVTFMTCQLFLDQLLVSYDKHTIALVALMEIPGLVIGLLLAQKVYVSWWIEIKTILLSKSIFLLLGGIFIGFISGEIGYKKVSPFFVDPFQGVLVLFMLEMGIFAALKMKEESFIPKSIILMGLLLPLLNGVLAIVVCLFFNMSIGNTTLMAAMSASASYIAAPAAVRLALPLANPSYYLTSAIVITFPFNLCIGIPFYYMLTGYLAKFF